MDVLEQIDLAKDVLFNYCNNLSLEECKTCSLKVNDKCFCRTIVILLCKLEEYEEISK